MDPITAAIVTALAIGVAGGVRQVGEKVIVDAYEGLKVVLRQKYGVNSDLVEAVEKLENKPDSEARKSMLQEEIKSIKADQDKEVLVAAKALTELINAQSGGEHYTQTITGSHNQAIQSRAGRDVTVNVNPPSSPRKTVLTKAQNLGQVAAVELLREISNVASGHYTPVDLENTFDAWQLAISSRLKEIDRERVNKISDAINRVVYGNDLGDFNPAVLRKEVKELTEIADKSSVWGGML